MQLKAPADKQNGTVWSVTIDCKSLTFSKGVRILHVCQKYYLRFSTAFFVQSSTVFEAYI